jgi:hypothetical protein
MVVYETNRGSLHWPMRFSQWNGIALMGGGAVVLCGWIFDCYILKRILPGLVAMNPVTALGFILAGISLLCFWRSGGSGQSATVLGRTFAVVLVGIGVLKLTEYLFGWRLAFDQILFRKQLLGDPTGFANQIAPNTAFNFVLGGLALWCLNGASRGFSKCAQNLALTLALVSLVPLIGYLYQASFLYSVGSYIPMALHTALFFFLLAGGIVLSWPSSCAKRRVAPSRAGCCRLPSPFRLHWGL